VPKNHHRLATCGDVDERNSAIGALIASLPQSAGQVLARLQSLQTTLFQVGALLATSTNPERLTQLESFTFEHTRSIGDTFWRKSG
jgi:cob(I)alamin adenosyltransferase